MNLPPDRISATQLQPFTIPDFSWKVGGLTVHGADAPEFQPPASTKVDYITMQSLTAAVHIGVNLCNRFLDLMDEKNIDIVAYSNRRHLRVDEYQSMFDIMFEKRLQECEQSMRAIIVSARDQLAAQIAQNAVHLKKAA